MDQKLADHSFYSHSDNRCYSTSCKLPAESHPKVDDQILITKRELFELVHRECGTLLKSKISDYEPSDWEKGYKTAIGNLSDNIKKSIFQIPPHRDNQRSGKFAAVYLILEADDKILLGRRQNTGYEDGNYQVPTGHIEQGELPTEAAIREAKEEVGITIHPGALELVHTMYRPRHTPGGDRIDFFFKVKSWLGQVQNMEPEKCNDLQWFDFQELPENISFHVKQGLAAVYSKIPFSEIKLETLKANGLYLLPE